MKLIKSSYEIIDNDNKQNYIDLHSKKHIERIGRVCWKSEDSISEDSYIKFWDNVVYKKKHNSITEHSAFTKIVDINIMRELNNIIFDKCLFTLLKHFKIDMNKNQKYYYISGNLRAWSELNQKLPNNKIYCLPNFNIETIKNIYPEIYKNHKFVSVKIIADLGVIYEFLRHRIMNETDSNIDVNFSYSQESSRYVNYTLLKHGGECKFIDIDDCKSFFKLKNVTDYNKGYNLLKEHLCEVENVYNTLTALGFPAEWSRAVLPKIAKSEIVISAYLDDWDKFFDLRTDLSAHPMARQITLELEKEFKNKNWRH